MITLKYELTVKNLYEYTVQILLKRTLIIGFAVSVFGIFFFTQVEANNVFLTAALICLVTTIIMTPMTVWEIKKNAETLGSGDAQTTLIFDDRIRLMEEKIKMEVEYSQVLRICETKNLYVLMIGRKNGIIIPRTAIDAQDFEEIRIRINEAKSR